MKIPDSFTQKYMAYTYDEDVNRNWQPGAVLRCLQQIATDHCDSFGMDNDFYQKTQTAFLLARLAVEFEKPLPIGCMYTFVSRPTGMNRAIYRRCTVVQDAAGKQVAIADSDWMLVDTSERRILRRQPESFDFVQWPAVLEDLPPLNKKVIKTEELTQAGNCKAGYSLCDENGHLNNTRYVELFLDALPAEQVVRGVKRLVISYHKETALGECFALQMGQINSNTWYFCGSREGHCCVEANIELF